VVAFCKKVVDNFQYATTVDHEDATHVIKAADVVHAAGRDDYLIEDGHGAADQARIAALRDDGKHIVIAVFEHLAYFRRGLRFQDEACVASVFVHPVAVERFEVVGGIGSDAVNDGRGVAKGRFEERDMVRCEFGELRVALERWVGVGCVRYPVVWFAGVALFAFASTKGGSELSWSNDRRPSIWATSGKERRTLWRSAT
jgi:hypothetical protein